jgi:ABC-type dipeptide/oligopeptide/nickel transport system ATPase component
MKINKISIENFKFYHNLEFKIKTKNCLIYGENGTGKSSIYEALYSNFYYYKDKKIANNQISIRDKFLHRDYMSRDLKVTILFDNNNDLIRKNDTLDNKKLLTEPFGSNSKLMSGLGDATIYFANEKILSNIVEDSFYDVIRNNLSIHFSKLESLETVYDNVKTALHHFPKNTELRDTDIIKKRVGSDELYKMKLKQSIPLSDINCILKKLQCDFEIEFSFVNSDIDIDAHQFSNPKISIKIKNIDDRNDFKNHFNEAKLKLISIAIYFALAKKYETKHRVKLLVLDDFLTSLDMANRKVIAKYILDNFEDYQIIILTHNLQFNNLIKRLLDNDKWDTKVLFNINEDNKIKPLIKDKDDNYIDEAKTFLDTSNYDLHIAGNLLRKAFESIVNEFEQLLELGKVETLQKIINVLKENDKYFYNKPHKVLEKLICDFEKMFENSKQSDNKKIEQVKSKINQIKENKITFIKQDGKVKEYNILKKTEFYKNILLNPSSHNDSENEIYKQECVSTITLLEELNNILKTLKK